MNNYIEQQIISQTDYRQQISDGKRLLQMLASGLFVITIVTILQDLIHSRLNNYSFYFSESLLFKTFWFLFLPLLLVQFELFEENKYKNCFSHTYGGFNSDISSPIVSAVSYIRCFGGLLFSHLFLLSNAEIHCFGRHL